MFGHIGLWMIKTDLAINIELFNGGDVMCKALDELYKDDELAILRAQVAELQKRIAQQ
jgi:hypothetical protein